MSSSFECSICRSHMAKQEAPAQLGSIDSCQHLHCFVCIKEWLETCSTCPICKQDVRVLHQHALTKEAETLLVDCEQLSIGEAHRLLHEHAPHMKVLEIQERKLAQEDPDPSSIPDPGHGEICEGAPSPSLVHLCHGLLHPMEAPCFC
jgi:hypothetical protein